MKGTILTIDVDGTMSPKRIDGEPTLGLLKEAIGGGLIEIIPGFDVFPDPTKQEMVSCVAFCDEEGKLNGLPPNPVATAIWHAALLDAGHPGLMDEQGHAVDYLVGKIAIVWGDRAFMEAL